ncbi:MAG: metal ABC transporter permease [Chloroflexi bacterium]|jgi:manganese/iron transport system permease protein|nr:metal ABC transporter permease [Chloroflexota bacterium]MBJ7360056.1 metal ABC transporter permease [Chloroflexota bacterium]MBJ7482265.1 metal ABC transporter permease [Chloroflexota bacterium]
MNPLDLLIAPLGYDFFVRALIASALVGVACAIVGSFVVLKGMSFIGDAVSHAAFPGIVIAYLIGAPIILGGAIAAIGTALGIGAITRRSGLRSDAIIGVLFAGMFALGVAIFSSIPNYVGDLFHFLFGDVLGISAGDLLALTLLVFGLLLVLRLLWKELLFSTFDPLGAGAAGLPVRRLDDLLLILIAVTIVISLQAVGIVLVVAMITTPAATAQLLVKRFTAMIQVAALIGVSAAIVGLYVSYSLDIASGAAIVLLETLIFLLALAFTLIRSRIYAARGAAKI